MPHIGLQQLMLMQHAATTRWPYVARRSDQIHRQRVGTVCQAASNNRTDLTAVVIGSGFSGLYAAAGLSTRFARVVRPTSSSRTDSSTHAVNHGRVYHKPHPVRCVAQTLLDKDELDDAVNVEKSSDPEIWRQQYEVFPDSRVFCIAPCVC